MIIPVCILLAMLQACNSSPAAVTPTGTHSASITQIPNQSPAIIPTMCASSIAAVTDTPEDSETIPGMREAGITEAQLEKITYLLYGAGDMEDFQSTSELTKADFFDFLFNELDMNVPEFDSTEIEYAELDYSYYNQYKAEDVESLIRSAFGSDYKTQDRGKIGDSLFCKNKIYNCMETMGSTVNSHILRFEKLSDTRTRLSAVFLDETDAEWYFCGKTQIVLEKDDNSFFGFQLVSKASVGLPSFPNATASSSKKGYEPKRAIDGKAKTGWATDKGEGEWLMLSADAEQPVSGVVIYIPAKELCEDDTAEELQVTFELSDGTTFDFGLDPYTEECAYFFGKEIETEYLKIIIYEPMKDKIQFIAEIRPY